MESRAYLFDTLPVENGCSKKQSCPRTQFFYAPMNNSVSKGKYHSIMSEIQTALTTAFIIQHEQMFLK